MPVDGPVTGPGELLRVGQVDIIADNPEDEEAARREFEREGLNLNYVGGSQYLGAYLGNGEELEAWVRPKVEAWDHRLRTLAKISKRYPQSAYAGLGMSLQIECLYPQRTIHGVGTLMGPIKDALREAFFPVLFGGEEVSPNLREILGHSVKLSGLGILYPRLLLDRT